MASSTNPLAMTRLKHKIDGQLNQTCVHPLLLKKGIKSSRENMTQALFLIGVQNDALCLKNKYSARSDAEIALQIL